MNNRFTTSCKEFFSKPFFSDSRTLLGLWTLLAIIATIAKMKPERCNNFLIFKGTFWHAWQGTSLYAPYPGMPGRVLHSMRPTPKNISM